MLNGGTVFFMTNMFDPTRGNIFGAAANAANEVFKLRKKEEAKGKKGASKVMKAIQDFHLAHEAVKEEIAKALSEDLGQEVTPDSDIVKNAVFSISLGKIFKNHDGQEMLDDDLKRALQLHDSESLQAKDAVANKLSQGSRMKVPASDNLVDQDIDAIALKTVENPDLLA